MRWGWKSTKLPIKLLEEELTELVEKIYKKVLKEKAVQCKINQVMIREESNQTFVNFLLKLNTEKYNIEGVGAGFVDAIVTSILKTLKHQYISLFDFYFSDFSIKANFGPCANKVRTDVPVIVKLCISNARENKFYFEGTSLSIISAITKTVEKMLNFLINCEEAVKCLNKIIVDAQKRDRVDLVDGSVSLLADLVKINDYSKLMKEEK